MRRLRSGKPDGPLPAIKAALESAGCHVVDIGGVGNGCPDLLVYRRATGLLRLLEVKDPSAMLKSGELRDRTSKTAERQAEFARKVPVWRVTSVDEALEAMEIERSDTRERSKVECAQPVPSDVKINRQSRRCRGGY